jgi:hypothetical protein
LNAAELSTTGCDRGILRAHHECPAAYGRRVDLLGESQQLRVIFVEHLDCAPDLTRHWPSRSNPHLDLTAVTKHGCELGRSFRVEAFALKARTCRSLTPIQEG